MSATLAPVALVGGWVVAGAVQPAGYDAVHDTISALAGHGAQHRWIMTAALAALGLAHVTTAAGLRGAPTVARLVLAVAGLATLGVAAFAEPAHGSSTAHGTAATVAFVLLALWPATLAAADGTGPRRRRVAFAVAATSVALLVWFAGTLSHGPVGVSERVLSAQQALWPLVVVLWARRAAMTDWRA